MFLKMDSNIFHYIYVDALQLHRNWAFDRQTFLHHFLQKDDIVNLNDSAFYCRKYRYFLRGGTEL